MLNELYTHKLNYWSVLFIQSPLESMRPSLLYSFTSCPCAEVIGYLTPKSFTKYHIGTTNPYIHCYKIRFEANKVQQLLQYDLSSANLSLVVIITKGLCFRHCFLPCGYKFANINWIQTSFSYWLLLWHKFCQNITWLFKFTWAMLYICIQYFAQWSRNPLTICISRTPTSQITSYWIIYSVLLIHFKPKFSVE